MDFEDIIKDMDKAIADFQKQIPFIQDEILDEMNLLIKELELTNNSIDNSIRNLKIIGQINTMINNIVLNQYYLSAVEDYLKVFDRVAKAQNKYFEGISSKFTTYELLNEIKKQSLTSVVEYLTEGGIRANIGQPLTDILRVNITSGGSYKDLSKQLGDFIKQGKNGVGALERYTSQITTDAINQFSGQYSQSITEHLGLKWYMYIGSNLETSREFCIRLTKKKYVYAPELPEIIKGEIDGHQCEINPKTDLPKGMRPGTNHSNFQVLRAGYNCGHQYVPVSEAVVPEPIKARAYAKFKGGEAKKVA